MKKSKNEEAKKQYASKPKKNINIKKIAKKFVARPIAFMVLFIFAAYGVRHALSTLQDTMQIGLTIFTVSAIGYILFDTTD